MGAHALTEALPRPSETSSATRYADLAAAHGLHQVGVRPPLATYVRQIWQRRHFALALGSAHAYARNQGSYLGQLWAILTPLLWAAVYLLVFGLMLGTDHGVGNYVAFLVASVFLFHFTSAAMNGGAHAIVGNIDLITSLQFPRALLCIAAVWSEFLALLPSLLVLFAIVPFSGEPPQLSWLLLPLAVALQGVFGIGVAFFTARLVSEIRDIAQLVPFVVRCLMYVSGVFFSLEHYVGAGTLGALMVHQPVAIYLELGRACLLSDTPITPELWLWAVGWAAATFVVGFVFFWRAEARYGRG